MSCVREASPPLQDADHIRHDLKKRRFLQPLRGLRRIFRRKGRPVISSSDGSVDVVTATLRSSKENFESCEQAVEATNLEPAKSHSTSHLTDDTTDNSQRRSLQSTLLSVSHDSVFTSEHRSPDSGSETSLYAPTRLGFPNSSVRAELFEAVKRRRALENNASDDEDLGLPRSPVSNSPTTADDMFTKEHIVTKSSQSTCSDGSLLSMGSSEIDEESYCHSSRHSSKLSLYEKRISTGSDIFSNNDKSSANTSSTSNNGTSLSHSAAKHKMAVKPKRNHGAPHKKRQIITSNTLPTTPEVNEENSHKNIPVEDKPVADSGQSDEHDSKQDHIHKTATSATRTAVEHHTSITQINTCSVTQSKCSSLPSGVSLSPVPSFKLLTRSKSNVVSSPSIPDDIDETVTSAENDLKKDDNASFFSRLLLRRSSKKKKNSTEEQDANQKIESEVQSWKVTPSEFREESTPVAYMNGLNNAMKHHPLFRQRIEPLNLSNDSMPGRMHMSMVPVNVNDDMKTPVKKSHSFRNHEKLPYSCYEDTPSLPVNIGLVEDETVTERFSKHFHKNHSPESPKFSYTSTPENGKQPESPSAETPDYEPAGIRVDNKWTVSSTKIHDYSNISVDCNKVHISVGDGGKGDKNDVKTPVPAPRTSLLSKSQEMFEISSKEEENVEVQDSHVNITVTELSSGQRSIVSIGSIEINSEPSSPLVDSVFEPTFNEGVKDEPETVQSDIKEIEKIDAENPTEIEVFESPEVPCKEKLEIEEPSNTEVPSESVSPKQDYPPVEKIEKPTHVVVTDFANGIVKVNDTTVVMRRKIKDVSQVKDDEPELMKVFARRSLKLKETDNLEELIDSVAKSRDSDKENEDSNSSSEERKKPEIKSEPPKNAFSKFQRSISHDVETNKNVSIFAPNGNEKKQRCKSIPNEMDMAPVKSPLLITNGEEKNDKIQLKSENVEEKVEKVEKVVTFKRIQQRREEWEKRAQQAMKVRGNN